MLTPHSLHSLFSLVASALDQTQQLFQLLETEQQALLSKDYDALEDISGKKLVLSRSLDLIEIQRQEIMAHIGQDTGINTMQQFLLANKNNAAFRPLLASWDRLIISLQESADQNRINGILLDKQHQHVQRALNILFEQSNNPPVYDAAGDTRQAKYTRSVGIA